MLDNSENKIFFSVRSNLNRTQLYMLEFDSTSTVRKVIIEQLQELYYYFVVAVDGLRFINDIHRGEIYYISVTA